MNARLTRGQSLVLAAATLPMIGAGVAGGWGTYTNIAAEFGRAATAIGVVAAGEGATLVLALVMLGLTMLGQAAPAPVRAGLWGAPLAAAATGLAVADNGTEAVVYAMTPMAMCVAAEGLGLLARRIVVHRTGIDMEVQRRNAETVQRLAYHQARAANHPSTRARRRSQLAAWRLAARVGEDDAELGAHLVQVQRERLRQGADAALGDMLTVKPATPPQQLVKDRSATAVLRERFAEMDPVDAVRIAHEAQPSLPPAELASQLIGYGVIVDAVQVALILGRAPAEVTVERAAQQGATPVAPQVGDERPALTKSDAIRDAALLLGPDAPAADIAAAVAARHRIDVKPNHVRAVLARPVKRGATPPQHPHDPRIGQGGEGYN